MTDWNMVVETFPNGRHNFPRFTRQSANTNKGPSRFTTTLRSVVALRGSFTYEDHATPWSTVARNLDVQVYRPPIATNYLGRAVHFQRHRQDPVLRAVPHRHAGRGSRSTAASCTSPRWT